MNSTRQIVADTEAVDVAQAGTRLIGDSAPMQVLRDLIARVAPAEVNVLITGETGTGKELVARRLHELSPRRGGPFVAVNCAAIPAALLESEFFGSEKGAFTGATAARAGRLEMARGGTLFLDEIGDMPLDLQAKLLRVLQERSFERVGGTRTLPLECRIVAATHADLRSAIAQGRFREDLFYRLNVVPLHVAPLRERREDIDPIFEHTRARAEAVHGTAFSLDDSAAELLHGHDWPGNVRELVNLVDRLAIMFAGRVVGAHELEPHLQARSAAAQPAPMAPPAAPAAENLDLRAALADLESRLIARALAASGGVVARAAGLLRIPRTTLIEKLQKQREVRDSNESEAQEVLHIGGSRRIAARVAGHRPAMGPEGSARIGLNGWRPSAIPAG
jgi:sigma-54 specific flagellar transcriptional regulator A